LLSYLNWSYRDSASGRWRALAILVFVLTAAGCGSSGSTSPPAPTSTTYSDTQYHFSFQVAAPWKIKANSGHIVDQPVRTYIVDITTPGNNEGVQFTVDQDLTPYIRIPEGKVVPNPGGGPDTLQYHHLTIAGWPALQVRRFTGAVVDSYDTITNTHDHSYDLRMATATPPFPATALRAYDTVLNTLKLPF
jgi:hypothetical protein